jgi:hypothetical protein
VNSNWPTVAANWGTPASFSFLRKVEEDVDAVLDLPSDDLEHSIVEIVDHYMQYKRTKTPPPTIEAHLRDALTAVEEKIEQRPRRRDEMERLRQMMIGNL